MKYLKILFFLFLLVGTILILRNHQSNAKLTYHVSEGQTFGTKYRVVYQSEESLDSIIEKELHKVDNSLSMFNKESTLSRINNGTSNKVDCLFCVVFKLAQEVAKSTGGAFDPTVAPAVNAWGFGPERKLQLSKATLDSIQQLVDYRKVQLQGDSLLLRADSRITLDYGAIAKGLGVDCIAHALTENGVMNFMVEIGGEVIVKGVNEKGTAWRIGVQKPTSNASDLQEVIQLEDAAMATSGNYRNFYVNADGKRVAHTIDPRTASPVSHALLSATVIAPSCAMADAYATSFMVVGVEGAKQILEAHPELSAYLIYEEADSLRVYSTLNR